MTKIISLLAVFLIGYTCHAQVEISGRVVDAITQTPLAGVNIKLAHKLAGTVTNPDGEFTLNSIETPPFKLLISIIGYNTFEFDVSGSIANLKIEMTEQVYLGEEIVVSASRIQENVLRSSVSVEKMDIRAINSTGAPIFMMPWLI